MNSESSTLDEPMTAPTERPLRLSLATPETLPDVMSLLIGYFAELPLFAGLTPAPDRQRAFRRHLIEAGVPHVIAYLRGDPIGLISWRYDTTMTVEPIADLGEFYVLPQFRRTPIGRALLNCALDIARQEGARVIRAEISSGLPAAISLRNLFRKHGGREVGATMHMEL